MGTTLVFGGTFNPIHNGHLHILQQFVDRYRFDHVLLIPTNIPPHKQTPDLANGADRLQMCRLAVQPYGYEVSDLELFRSGPSYTVDTLEILKRQNPQERLALLMGEDMFTTLLHWRSPERIFVLADIYAAPRSNAEDKNLKRYAELYVRDYGARVFIQNIDYLPISSTEIRSCVLQGKDIRTFVPLAVAEYIAANHLYKEPML